MTRIDKTFRTLSELYEFNRQIRQYKIMPEKKQMKSKKPESCKTSNGILQSK
jgi:hypothetical protein